jgi:hypothetical protein
MQCQIAFFVLQAHHDLCDHDDLTVSQERLVHDFEAGCLNCVMSRAYDVDLRDCNQPACEDNAPAEAAYQLLEVQCETDPSSCCSSVEQQTAFAVLWEYHELCDHDDITADQEHGLHEFEDACTSFAQCNTPLSKTEGYDPTICISEECQDASAAEIACKAANACDACSDFNFGDDCSSNKAEHCAEIDCCSACEAEIRAMWVCEHGTVCGDEFSCSVPAHELPMICRADQDQDGLVDVNDILAVLGAFNIMTPECRF